MDCSSRYSCLESIVKRRFVTLLVVGAALAAAPAFADVRQDAKSQVDFGVNVALRGLWREAIPPRAKAVELHPTHPPPVQHPPPGLTHDENHVKPRHATP